MSWGGSTRSDWGKNMSIVMLGERKHACTLSDVATCTCNKPKLRHKPCPHVYKACAQVRQISTSYISKYYNMYYLFGTWSAKFHLYGVDMNCRDLWPDRVKWGPNIALKATGKGRRQMRCFWNNMDNNQRGGLSRARKCRICKTIGHSIKDFPQQTELV